MKYIHWFYSANGFSQSEELYYVDDLFETNNVIEANSTIMTNMLYPKYDAWMTQWSADATTRDRYVDYPALMARGVDMSTDFTEAYVKEIMSPKASADYLIHSNNSLPKYPAGYDTNQVVIGSW